MENNKSYLGTILLLLATLAVIVLVVMMFGAHLDLWEPIVGFGMIRTYMNPIGYALTGLGVVGLIYLIVQKKSGAIKAGLTALIGLGVLTPMILSVVNPPVRGPAIHDITTNTVNPPQFLVLDETRKGAKNTLVYGGAEIAEQQVKAYPYIKPIQSNLKSVDAFAKALSIGKDMGWEIVVQDEVALRFEATARTPVYQFADDVVVLITAEGSASRVDIRSVSRIGRSDRGVNAERIMEFTQHFTK